MSRAGPAQAGVRAALEPRVGDRGVAGPSSALRAGPSCLFQLLVPRHPLARGCLLPLPVTMSVCLSVSHKDVSLDLGHLNAG